jgi:hypothetical protein
MGRLTERGRVIVVGTAFHPEDLLHRMAAQTGWRSARYAITDENGNSRWPERWSAERIERKRLELGPAESARQLDVMARSDEDARFKSAWIEVALQAGQKMYVEPHLLATPKGCRVVCGVDLAVSTKRTADLTVLFTALVYPDGRRRVLHIRSGRWAGPEIVDRVREVRRLFEPEVIVVESNAAQAYIAQMVEKMEGAQSVVGYTTGSGERSLPWQVEQLAAEFARGVWMLPSGDDGRTLHPEVAAFAKDLLFYSPSAHTPDRVAACCFCRYGIERGEVKAEIGRLNLHGYL